MTIFTEGRHSTEGLLSEANFHRSRDNIVIAAGAGLIVAGMVLGKVTASGKYVPSANAEITGEEGAEVGAAIALYNCDATSADQKVAAITRDAEWNGNTLSFDSTVNDAGKKATKVAQLAAKGIIARY
ncbi:MAG: hypothetical protein BGO05_05425 [Rhizobiales bacterium 63-7]|nr:head decoration protein [Hyphomicrobiales bacterium]OJU66643.1 MAG: hypothetical protein BGO05_05425 [Rhizobiales bacterium 63-7]